MWTLWKSSFSFTFKRLDQASAKMHYSQWNISLILYCRYLEAYIFWQYYCSNRTVKREGLLRTTLRLWWAGFWKWACVLENGENSLCMFHLKGQKGDVVNFFSDFAIYQPLVTWPSSSSFLKTKPPHTLKPNPIPPIKKKKK